MAANVETMFCAKTPAWHGLGTVVKEAPSSEEAIRLAGLDWEVHSEPIFLKDKVLIEDRFANVRVSDRKVLGILGKQYKIVQNKEAFDFVDSLLGEGITFESAGSLNEGRRIWLLANLPSKKILGDEIVPYLVFSNSHDGSKAVTAALTPTRVVCQNTLNLALNGAKRSWTIRHIGNIAKKKDEALHTLNLAFSYMDKMEEKAELLQQVKIKDFSSIVKAVYPIEEEASDRVRSNIDQLRSDVEGIYNFTEDLKKFKGSAWGVYNAFADHVSHVLPIRNTETLKERRFISLIDGNKILEKVQGILDKMAA